MRTPDTGLLRYAARVRRGFAVLGLVLLAASVTPCAMALDLVHSCAHCPSRVEDAGNRHHDRHNLHDPHAGHGGHAEAATGGCDSLQGPCGDDDEINADARPAQPKVKDGSELPAIAIAPRGDLDVCIAREHYPAVDPPLRRYPSRAIHLLNCVFRD